MLAQSTQIFTSSSGSTDNVAIYYVQPGTANKSDVFRVVYTRTSKGQLALGEELNFTQSPTIDELWPVPSPDGDKLAYFGISSDGERDLWVESLDGNRKPVNLTKNTAGTRLHQGFEIKVDLPAQWSPDGQWLFFLVQQADGKGNTVELYIANPGTGQVFQRNTEGIQVESAEWQNNLEILYLARRKDGRLALYILDWLSGDSTLLSEINLPNYR